MSFMDQEYFLVVGAMCHRLRQKYGISVGRSVNRGLPLPFKSVHENYIHMLHKIAHCKAAYIDSKSLVYTTAWSMNVLSV